ncbi:M20/M25/M40 family metallo-hydrolase, partial [Sphingomonas sp. ZB1N12]
CLDPIPVACEIVTALSTFIARQIAVTDPAVLSITKIDAGSAYNIVPECVEMKGTLRTLSNATREQAQAGIARVVEHVALAHGCTAELRIDEGYPVTENDPRAVAMIRAVAERIGAYETMPAPMMGGEDFSYVLREIPGAMAFVGVAPEGSDPRTNPPLHNTKMTIREDVMAKGVAMHCALAERFLNHGFD